jgi:hypothetical protein
MFEVLHNQSAANKARKSAGADCVHEDRIYQNHHPNPSTGELQIIICRVSPIRFIMVGKNQTDLPDGIFNGPPSPARH